MLYGGRLSLESPSPGAGFWGSSKCVTMFKLLPQLWGLGHNRIWVLRSAFHSHSRLHSIFACPHQPYWHVCVFFLRFRKSWELPGPSKLGWRKLGSFIGLVPPPPPPIHLVIFLMFIIFLTLFSSEHFRSCDGFILWHLCSIWVWTSRAMLILAEDLICNTPEKVSPTQHIQ